jgi:hypothetical protein
VFVVINRAAIDKLKNIGYQIDNNYENKEASTFAEVEANENPKKQIDTNIISQNKENNTSDLIEDDIEVKNKRLMEQEKTFIPSFNMRWN